MSQRENRFLAVALAATVLHVVDDATLHREPGTTVADHVTGAGATLAVLAVAATVFPRLRAGFQRRVVGFFDTSLARSRDA
jgi:hypothetical protein